MFHFVFPEEQRVIPVRSTDETDDDEDDSAESSSATATITPPKTSPRKNLKI